ncbi:MAG: peptidoglycan bridge formation glycyltransferase FemA/FemB family protein [bacterium]|nr:peptidoglycan bridge formation glycyltransferase FemA/FemB family protein [bacterium]
MEFIDGLKKEEYTDFVYSHPNGHFLKSYEWGQVSKERGLIPYYVGMRDGEKLVASALLLKKSLPLGYSYFYIPRGYTIDYDNYELLKQFTLEIKKFTKQHKSLFFKIDPDIYLHHIDCCAQVIPDDDNHYELVDQFLKMGFQRRKLTKFFETMQPRFTFRVSLDDMDAVRKRYSKTVHRFVKLADKYGVKVHVGSKENLSDFVRLMKLTEKRQSFFSHEYDFYEKFYELFGENGYVDLLYATVDVKQVLVVIQEDLDKLDVAKEENRDRYQKLVHMKAHFQALDSRHEKIVSAYFNVNYGNKSWYLYGANDMDYKLTYANYKLFDFQIENAYRHQKEIFDEFGTIGDVHTDKSVIGLHEFKKKFGGEYTEFIGEFDYITRPFMYFVFMKLVPLYRKPMKFFRHLRVRFQKDYS